MKRGLSDCTIPHGELRLFHQKPWSEPRTTVLWEVKKRRRSIRMVWVVKKKKNQCGLGRVPRCCGWRRQPGCSWRWPATPPSSLHSVFRSRPHTQTYTTLMFHLICQRGILPPVLWVVSQCCGWSRRRSSITVLWVVPRCCGWRPLRGCSWRWPATRPSSLHTAFWGLGFGVQGYLAHKKSPPPLRIS